MKKCAYFRFYEELNDFLPPEKQKVDFEYCFEGSPSIKHAIEAIGVPHRSIDLILVNGESVDFSKELSDGDRISVYPIFESFDIASVSSLPERPLRDPKFLLDVHLGKLAKYLRLLGFDTLYENNYSDEDIIGVLGHEPGRIVLTRDRGLLKRKKVTHGYWIRNKEVSRQVDEVMARFQLHSLIRPFSRCMTCNGELIDAHKEDVIAKIPGKVAEYVGEFTKCGKCHRIYWPGTHYSRMKSFIDDIIHRKESDL